MSRIFGFSIARSLGTLGTALFALALASCDGHIGDSHSAKPAVTIPVVTHSRFPRLSHRQWENTIVDLFHFAGPTGLSQAFYPDPLGGKTFDNDESVLEVTPELWAGYETAAETIASLVTAAPSLLAQIAPPDPSASATARRDAFIRAFGMRAFRRPLSDDEVTTFAAKFDEAASLDTAHDAFTAGVGLVVESMLESPYFLYRAELSSTPASDGLIHLSGYEIATKLSYALWNTMPDDALFASAGSGELDTAAGVEAKAREMLADPRAAATILAFHHELYQVDQYKTMPAKDPTAYPGFDPSIAQDMEAEADRFVQHTVIDNDGGLKELLTSNTTFVNSRLAKIYGLDPSAHSATVFDAVDLDPNERPGLLTRSGFLAWKGRATEPDTILRGVFVNRLILCQELGDPPPAAAGAKLGNQPTDRGRVEALTGKGTCGASCHGVYIDPIGYAFEGFDAIGRARVLDNGYPIDTSASFPFDGKQQRYQGVAGLASLLAGSAQAHACYAGYWLSFLYGRDKRAADQPQIDAIAALSRGGGTVRDIVLALLTTESFRTRTQDPEEAP